MALLSTANRKIITNNKNSNHKKSKTTSNLVVVTKAEIFSKIHNVVIGKNEIKIFFTKNQTLLDQYYILRQKIYREDLGFKDYDGSENEYDRNGFVIVAVNNDSHVVGGIRVNYSNGNKILSNEIPEKNFYYYRIAKFFGVNLSDDNYSEICTLILEKDFRNRAILTKFLSMITSLCVIEKSKYSFAIAPNVVSARDYRLVYSKLGINCQIINDFPCPQIEKYNDVNVIPLIITNY